MKVNALAICTLPFLLAVFTKACMCFSLGKGGPLYSTSFFEGLCNALMSCTGTNHPTGDIIGQAGSQLVVLVFLSTNTCMEDSISWFQFPPMPGIYL